MTTDNLVKHGFPRPQDMCLTEDINRFFLLGVQNFEDISKIRGGFNEEHLGHLHANLIYLNS